MPKKKDILISIHDVMPSNLSKIDKIITNLNNNHNIKQITLLIVPGLKWNENQISKLNNLAKQGHELAGHGWIHKTNQINTLYHKCHSKLISRDVAEHLSMNKEDILRLLENCYNWFKSSNLPIPNLYVPPAWAIGNLNNNDFKKTKFKMFETLNGIYFKDKFYNLPLLGYEADTLFRKTAVRISNFSNKLISKLLNLPIRLSIHPNDFELLVAKDLINDLKLNAIFWSYENFFNSKN